MAKFVKLENGAYVNIDKIDFIDKDHIVYMDVGSITFNISDADVDAILRASKED